MEWIKEHIKIWIKMLTNQTYLDKNQINSLKKLMELVLEEINSKPQASPSARPHNNDFKKDCHNCFDANCPDKIQYNWKGCKAWRKQSFLKS